MSIFNGNTFNLNTFDCGVGVEEIISTEVINLPINCVMGEEALQLTKLMGDNPNAPTHFKELKRMFVGGLRGQ